MLAFVSSHVCPLHSLPQLSSFQSLDSSQISHLRSIFLSFSDRPADTSHVYDFVRKQYGHIPAKSRGSLGQGVAEAFRVGERAEEARRLAHERRVLSLPSSESGVAVPTAPRRAPAPRITWKSFHRVCAALGLHLGEKRGQATIKELSGPSESSSSSAATAGSTALAAAITPGMSFDDFMIFYANVTKPLSVVQEMREVWRLLDDDLDGLVPLATLRQSMIGLEHISPTNTQANSKFYYQPNYQYHYTDAEKKLTAEQLVGNLLAKHFVDKNLERDSINFQEFVEFMTC